ncbi:MAG TPA: Rossmann-like and DUF2520 domain-containing protein [Pyrinomonadaceae bacterium]|nr:Rossmann-like and DUF2520 domain-containing protein [Pyrinomonadaceae bacterium]
MPPERNNRSAKKIQGGESRKTKSREAGAHEAKARPAKAHRARTHDAKTREVKARDAKARQARPTAPRTTSSVSRPASPKQTSVAIIGAGRLGSALALALSENGYRVAALVARRVRRARLAARAVTPRPLALDATQLNSLPDTDLILVTTPDDQIAEVALRLAQAWAKRSEMRHAMLPRPSRRPVALHASGALPSDVLSPLAAHAFSVGSLHPLVSISDAAAGGASNLRGAFSCLEGEARARRAARKIVGALGGRSFSVAARDKALYHAAAVITSGHTVALFSLAAELLARCGLSDARAQQVLLPLLGSTLDNLRAHEPERALTGTFARADLSTVRKHLAALGGANVKDALAIYALLGGRSLRLAARRNEFAPPLSVEIERLLRKAFKASLK